MINTLFLGDKIQKKKKIIMCVLQQFVLLCIKSR